MKKLLKKFLVGLMFFAPILVSAQAQGPGFTFENPIDADNIFELIAQVLSFVSAFGAVIVVLAIIYSGFLFVKAQGNDSEISKAKSVFFWSVVGAIVLLGAQVLAEIICNTAASLGAGVECSNLITPTMGSGGGVQ